MAQAGAWLRARPARPASARVAEVGAPARWACPAGPRRPAWPRVGCLARWAGTRLASVSGPARASVRPIRAAKAH